MKITSLKIRNYRTLEQVDLDFPASYSAICGPNDSGKTNVVRSIRALMKEESPFQVFAFEDEQELSLKEDYPRWKDTAPSERRIQLELSLKIERDRDAGFYQFLTKQLSLEIVDEDIALTVHVNHGPDRSEPEVRVTCSGKKYTGIEAQEVLKRLQSSRSILFHNSTQVDPRFPFRHRLGVIRSESAEHEALVASMKNTVNRGLAKISRTHQRELEGLLGRLETKYKVGLSMPAFDFSSVPYSVTLGQKKFEVPLDDWGSGTKNRTLILMTLFRAKQLSESEASAAKVTPAIVIEEPESFLHPAAQAEFGRVLHDLAEEFQIQVIVTTHSPYLLNMHGPASNLLLRRHTRYKQFQETERVDTSGDNWMQPFSLALGLESEEFKPWKELLLATADAILLVEGEADKEYFQMLRDPAHGTNRLEFSGEVVSYDGTGSLQNTVLLRFIKNRYRKLFVTYDLDAEEHLVRAFQAVGLEKRRHFAPVGLDGAGKRNIEGLLPESVTTAVYGANPSVVQAVAHGTKKEQESARGCLKRLLLEEFKKKARPGQEFFGNFYPLVKVINKALGSAEST
jgi:putative ATP-dependent endonuclease of the OLD family